MLLDSSLGCTVADFRLVFNLLGRLSPASATPPPAGVWDKAVWIAKAISCWLQGLVNLHTPKLAGSAVSSA